MTAGQLNRAGWLAVLGAVLTVPQFVFSLVVAVGSPRGAALLADRVVGSLIVAISLYLLICLRRLLNSRFSFHDTDNLITAMIWTSAGGWLLSVLAPPDRFTALDAIALLVGIALAVLTVVFGIKLLRLSEDLYGLLKPFAYTLIAAAVLAATVILLPVGVLVDVANNVILAMVFFRAAGQPSPGSP